MTKMLRSQKPWTKGNAPREEEPGYENQVRALAEQVMLVSERLDELTICTTQGKYICPVTTSKPQKVWPFG